MAERGSVAIDIPDACLPNGLTVFLNRLNLSYGQYHGGVPYWVLQFGVDLGPTVDDVGTCHLVLLDARVERSCIEFAESERVLADGSPLCGSR